MTEHVFYHEHMFGVKVRECPLKRCPLALEQTARGFALPRGGLFSEDDVLLQSGMADTWDDARLGMIENLYPPSGEQ